MTQKYGYQNLLNPSYDLSKFRGIKRLSDGSDKIKKKSKTCKCGTKLNQYNKGKKCHKCIKNDLMSVYP
jgi:hypothetical protein